jgi:AcrR family transcriptional regulator
MPPSSSWSAADALRCNVTTRRYAVNVGRPREHDEGTAAALLDAAERIIEEQGVDALSVRGVADDVGTTTRAVYSLFGSKEGLLVALAAHGFRVLRDAVAAQRATGDPARDLALAGLRFRRWAIEHPSLFRVSVQRMIPHLPEPGLASRFGAAANETFAVLEAKVQRVKDAGLLGDRSVREAAVEYHALCEGLANVELRGSLLPPGREEQAWREALSALVAGFAAEPPG